jgi:hypothetical protein
MNLRVYQIIFTLFDAQLHFMQTLLKQFLSINNFVLLKAGLKSKFSLDSERVTGNFLNRR